MYWKKNRMDCDINSSPHKIVLCFAAPETFKLETWNKHSVAGENIKDGQ